MKVACVYIADTCPRAERLAHTFGSWTFVKVPVLTSKPSWSRAINFLLLLCGLHSLYAARQSYTLDLSEYDAVVCHDLILLPWLINHYRECLIVVDLREYYPRHFEHSFWWRLIWGRYYDYLVRNQLSFAQACVTVSKGLSNLYRTNYGIDAKTIESYAEASGLNYRASSKPIRLVHMGNASRHRQLENMIEALDCTDGDYDLDLFLVRTDDRYYQELKRRVNSTKYIRLRKPVPFSEIHKTLNDYDIGLFTVPATTNLKHSLPNKIYDYIQANLAILVSPLPDCADFVERWGVGKVAKSANPKAIAEVLDALDVHEIDAMKQRSHAVSLNLHAGEFRDAFRNELARLAL